MIIYCLFNISRTFINYKLIWYHVKLYAFNFIQGPHFHQEVTGLKNFEGTIVICVMGVCELLINLGEGG